MSPLPAPLQLAPEVQKKTNRKSKVPLSFSTALQIHEFQLFSLRFHPLLNVYVVWMFMSPPDSYVETLTRSVMVLEVGPLGRWLGCEIRSFLMGSVSYKRRPERDPLPFYRVRTQGEDACNGPGRGPSLEHDHAGALTLGFQPPEQWEDEFLLFMSHPICGYFLMAPGTE